MKMLALIIAVFLFVLSACNGSSADVHLQNPPVREDIQAPPDLESEDDRSDRLYPAGEFLAVGEIFDLGVYLFLEANLAWVQARFVDDYIHIWSGHPVNPERFDRTIRFCPRSGQIISSHDISITPLSMGFYYSNRKGDNSNRLITLYDSDLNIIVEHDSRFLPSIDPMWYWGLTKPSIDGRYLFSYQHETIILIDTSSGEIRYIDLHTLLGESAFIQTILFNGRIFYFIAYPHPDSETSYVFFYDITTDRFASHNMDFSIMDNSVLWDFSFEYVGNSRVWIRHSGLESNEMFGLLLDAAEDAVSPAVRIDMGGEALKMSEDVLIRAVGDDSVMVSGFLYQRIEGFNIYCTSDLTLIKSINITSGNAPLYHPFFGDLWISRDMDYILVLGHI